jgi:fumarylacetoacetase
VGDLDETHDPNLQSWVESANTPDTDFPIQNLPIGMFSRKEEIPHPGVAIGDQVFDLKEFAGQETLAQDRRSLSEMRLEVSRVLRADNPQPPRHCLRPMSECRMHLPFAIGDYTDFFASIFHATNVGTMFRPDKPTLVPHYKWMPIAYHGRASSIVPSGTPVRRPRGQLQDGGSSPPVFAPSQQLDYEGEVGFFIGSSNSLGAPIPITEAEDHILGLCLLNDWSARDIQRWEYQPLGPFLSKSFATTISPWIVTLDALKPFRTPRYRRPEGDPAPLPYLDCESDRDRGGIAIRVEVWLSTAKMRGSSLAPVRLSRAGFAQMYWSIGQMLTHHASNGCNLRSGDLLASGTVSGPEKDARGCLLELTWRGTEPVSLPTGESRRFLEDGDEVIMRGYAESAGARRIGFGECRGTLVA